MLLFLLLGCPPGTKPETDDTSDTDPARTDTARGDTHTDTASGADTDTDVDTDTGPDTETDTDTRVFELTGGMSGEGVEGDCAGGVCVYRITTSHAARALELDITETADTSSSPWEENHTAFTLETVNADGSETYRLDLAWVTDYRDQVTNENTLLNPGARSDMMGRLTWYFGATSEDGTGFDCVVTGQDPSFYVDAGWCGYVAR